MSSVCSSFLYFFFNDTATTEIYTLSLHDALPICGPMGPVCTDLQGDPNNCGGCGSLCSPGLFCVMGTCTALPCRSEEHTSELQSRRDLVCRLLLEKKKITNITTHTE